MCRPPRVPGGPQCAGCSVMERDISESGFLVCFAFENSRQAAGGPSSSVSDQIHVDSKSHDCTYTLLPWSISESGRTLGLDQTDALSPEACCLLAKKGWGLQLSVNTKYFIFIYLDQGNNN